MFYESFARLLFFRATVAVGFCFDALFVRFKCPPMLARKFPLHATDDTDILFINTLLRGNKEKSDTL